MRHDSLETYLTKLAAHTSTPGGGAAAALTAAQAASLLSMVGHFSLGKKASTLDWSAFIKRMDLARQSFLDLAEEDARAFQQVMDCYRLPTNDAARTTKMEKALVGAAETPLVLIEDAWTLLQSLSPYIEDANAHVVSDAGIAVSLLRASIDASIFNVVINRKFMKVSANKEGVSARLEAVQSVYESTCAALYHQAMDATVMPRA